MSFKQFMAEAKEKDIMDEHEAMISQIKDFMSGGDVDDERVGAFAKEDMQMDETEVRNLIYQILGELLQGSMGGGEEEAIGDELDVIGDGDGDADDFIDDDIDGAKIVRVSIADDEDDLDY